MYMGNSNTKRKRWVDSKHGDCSDEAPACKKKREKKKTNDANQILPVAETEVEPPLATNLEPDGQAEGPSVSKSTTGRSSFWERRKVWNIHELLAETEHIQPMAARNIVQLFENENTIPFICR